MSATPQATGSDRDLAEKLVRVINGSLRAVIPNDLPNISFADNCANTFEKAIASHVAARLAHVEAERDALSKDRDSWKVMAECLDVKVLHEQIDHNKTIDGPLALARAERDALRATVAALEAENRALREALSKFFDQADEENFAPTKDCFVHCEGCDPSFDCWRHSDGCRKTLAPKEGNAP